MHYEKKVVDTLEKCYAISMFDGADQNSFLIGVEKEGPIKRYALDGTYLETICNGPGGVMTLVQVPERHDQVLATCEFYSPNCGGDDARIVAYTKQSNDVWAKNTVSKLKYVHRFGLLDGEDGTRWLLACTIKDACAYKNDWRFPGSVFAGPITQEFEHYNDTNQMSLEKIASHQLKNHGFYVSPTHSYAYIATDDGVFRYTPPKTQDGQWNIEHVLRLPVSDVAEVDLDQDGKLELITISPFHGDTVSIWHLDEDGMYYPAWTDTKKREFMHAIWSGNLCGQSCAILGHRKGDRDLLRIFFKDGQYQIECIDHDCGPTNVWTYTDNRGDHIIAANRETNEVALYNVR